MTKYLLLLLPLLGFSSSIQLEHAAFKPLGTVIQTNAQITQLTEQKQEIVSRLLGHIELYYVSAGQTVKVDDKIALIESIELSKMSAEYLSLSKQSKAAKTQLNTAKTLHEKGLSSQNDISNAIILLEDIDAKQNALTSQLNSLGINPETLTKATDKYTLYAHSDGIIGTILAPLHANVDAQTPLMTLVSQSAYYAIAYISTQDAMSINHSTKGWIHIANHAYACHFVQLLPHIDKETQRAQVLFQIENAPKNILLGTYNQIDISLISQTRHVMVKKSALTLYQGEWVVFVKTAHKEHDISDASKVRHYDSLEHQGHDDHESHDTHKEVQEDHHDEHAHSEHGHDTHNEEEAPYEAKVVEIVSYVGDNVAIKGLKENEQYVSEGVYFVKSMLLKSSLGGHGH